MTNGDAAFFIFIIALVFMCDGEPDVLDGITYQLMDQCTEVAK